MFKRLLMTGAIGCVLLTGTAQADSTIAGVANADTARSTAAKDGWQGSVALGYLETTGNSNTSSLNAKSLLGYKSGNWQDAILFQTLRATDTGMVVAENTNINGQTDYNFTAKNYLFGNVDYLRDVFSGYERRTSEILGVGRHLYDSDTQQLDVQVGAGERQTRYTDQTSINEAVEVLSGAYQWKFSPNSTFSENISVEHGVSNTYSQSVTALTLNIAGNFALALSYTASHNSTVLPTFKNTDTVTAVSLVYTFPLSSPPPVCPTVLPPPPAAPDAPATSQ